MFTIVSPLLLGLFTQAVPPTEPTVTVDRSAVPALDLSSDADAGGGLIYTGEVLGWATKGEHIVLNIDGKLFQFTDSTGTVPVPEIGTKVTVLGYWEAPANSGMDFIGLLFIAH